MKKNSHVQGVGVGIWFSNVVYQLSFNIFILEALRKFKINNEAGTSFKIEMIKLLLTMPHPRADLLRQMAHPGEDKVVKCPTNARGGCVRLELTEPQVTHDIYGTFEHNCRTCDI